MKQYYFYILASKKNGTVYIGVTGDLYRRICEHKNNIIEGFTKKYNVHILVYYELYSDIHSAIARETQVKRWKRQWKIELIEKGNLDWVDLFEEVNGC